MLKWGSCWAVSSGISSFKPALLTLFITYIKVLQLPKQLPNVLFTERNYFSITTPKALSSRRHSSILRWNLILRRIKTELRSRRNQAWQRHTTLEHPHWPPCWQTLERPRTGTARAGNLLPQPHPSVTQLSVLPGCARALTTNHPWRESLCWAALDKTAQFKFLPRSLETLTPVPPFLWGWGQGAEKKRKKERSCPFHHEASTKWCRELYLCREHETNTRRWEEPHFRRH